MSLHNGVSCDSCMRKDFPGRRYKCLLCDNFDLCGACYDLAAESKNHKNDHPMQCILTEAASELFYAGESIPRRSAVSLTCSHCGLSGFIPRTLLTHCVEKHESSWSQTKNTQVVMCPICVTSPNQRSRSRYVSLADHIAATHDENTTVEDEDPLSSFIIQKDERGEREEEDSDEEDDDDEDGPPLNDLEHRGFIEEEHRRQEAAHRRLAHATSLAAAIRNEYAASSNGRGSVQRRPFLRQTALRGARGGLRGHFSGFPYGSSSRTSTGNTSNISNRNASDASTPSPSQSSSTNIFSASSLFPQDPMLEFVSRLVSNQQTPSANSTNSPFLFASSIPISIPNSANTGEFARLQQQIEANESANAVKTTSWRTKQNRSSQNQHQQQQQTTPSVQSVILSNPIGYDQFWQQQFPPLQPAFYQLNFANGMGSTESTTGNSNAASSLSKSSQTSNREYNPRSLLGKLWRNEQGVNNDEFNSTRARQVQDHISYLQSLFLSSITTVSNDDENEHESTTNKENLC